MTVGTKRKCGQYSSTSTRTFVSGGAALCFCGKFVMVWPMLVKNWKKLTGPMQARVLRLGAEAARRGMRRVVENDHKCKMFGEYIYSPEGDTVKAKRGCIIGCIPVFNTSSPRCWPIRGREKPGIPATPSDHSDVLPLRHRQRNASTLATLPRQGNLESGAILEHREWTY